MKIIFDSEEQSRAVLGHLTGCGCPGNYFLPEIENCNCPDSCEECWKLSGIETEVLSNEDNI